MNPRSRVVVVASYPSYAMARWTAAKLADAGLPSDRVAVARQAAVVGAPREHGGAPFFRWVPAGALVGAWIGFGVGIVYRAETLPAAVINSLSGLLVGIGLALAGATVFSLWRATRKEGDDERLPYCVVVPAEESTKGRALIAHPSFQMGWPWHLPPGPSIDAAVQDAPGGRLLVGRRWRRRAVSGQTGRAR